MPITDGKEVSSSVFAKMRKNEIGVLVLFGFLGLKPVFVANENLVTQLSNFLA